MNEQPTALQLVMIELDALGVKDIKRSPVYAAIRWLIAETAYVRLQESTNSAGQALQNMRHESAHWKEHYEQIHSIGPEEVKT